MRQQTVWWEHRRLIAFLVVCLVVAAWPSPAQDVNANSAPVAKADKSDGSDGSDQSDKAAPATEATPPGKPAASAPSTEATPPGKPAASAPSTEAAPPEKPAASAAEPSEATPKESPEKAAKEKKWISGRFEAGVRGEWSDDDSDVNVNQTLRLKVDPPEYPKLHINGSLWMLEDLDSDERRESPLRDVNDAYDSDVRARLLDLNVQLDDLWGKSTLRLGRQRIPEGSGWNLVDGVYFKKTMSCWDWYVYGGARASVYRDTHDDAALGGGVSYKPWDTTRLALDVSYGNEHRDDDRDMEFDRRSEVLNVVFSPAPGKAAWRALREHSDWSDRPTINETVRGAFMEAAGLPSERREDEDLDNARVSLSLWQTVNPNLTLMGRFSLVNGRSDDVLLTATGSVPTWELTYDLTFRARLRDAGDRINGVGAYYRILGEAEAYQDVLLALHRPLTEKLTLSLEGEFRNSDSDYPRLGNRDYTRYAASLSAAKLWAGMKATVSFERWDVDRGADVSSVSGEISQEFCKGVTVALGADYERYGEPTFHDADTYWQAQLRAGRVTSLWELGSAFARESEFVGIETRDNVHSVYGRVKWSIDEAQSLAGRVSYEEDDGADSPYWRVQADYTVKF